MYIDSMRFQACDGLRAPSTNWSEWWASKVWFDLNCERPKYELIWIVSTQVQIDLNCERQITNWSELWAPKYELIWIVSAQ